MELQNLEISFEIDGKKFDGIKPATLQELDDMNDYEACYVQSESVCTDFIKQKPHDVCKPGHIKLEIKYANGEKLPALFMTNVLKFDPVALQERAESLGVRSHD